MLGKIQHDYSLGRIIVVADRGITTGDNIWYTLSAKNGYILKLLCSWFWIKSLRITFLMKNGYTDKRGSFSR